MKRKFMMQCAIWLVIISGILFYCDSEKEEEMLIYSSSPMLTGDYHNERIVVVVNQRKISDRQDLAERIVQKCRDNSFKNVRFSYDLSKPNRLDVTVCLDEKEADQGEWEFQFRYVQKETDERYNIIDHPEKFRIEILTD